MSEKREKRPQYVLPPGEAVWPWINKYDERDIKGKPQKPAYKLNVRYAANSPAWLQAKEVIDGLVEAAYDAAVEDNPKKKKLITRQYPYTLDTDDDGEENGFVTVKLKQSAFIPDKQTKLLRLVTIAKFDARGVPIRDSLEVVWDEEAQAAKGVKGNVAVYGGSIVKAAFTTRPYLVDSTNGAGVSMDLKAVQVLTLVTSGERSASSFGFGAEEGYESEEGDYEDTTKSTSTVDDASDPTDF